jgi:hypothetical protein
MAQEFTIKSQQIEDKINQLLPSQGGFQAGVDFSASTMVIPIVDLTETAEGSALRVDLQSCFSFATSTSFSVSNTTTTVINTTGYWRIAGTSNIVTRNASDVTNSILINDGTTDKAVWTQQATSTGDKLASVSFDFIVKLEAGHSLKVSSNGTETDIGGAVRQIADLQGNLVNP